MSKTLNQTHSISKSKFLRADPFAIEQTQLRDTTQLTYCKHTSHLVVMQYTLSYSFNPVKPAI